MKTLVKAALVISLSLFASCSVSNKNNKALSAAPSDAQKIELAKTSYAELLRAYDSNPNTIDCQTLSPVFNNLSVAYDITTKASDKELSQELLQSQQSVIALMQSKKCTAQSGLSNRVDEIRDRYKNKRIN